MKKFCLHDYIDGQEFERTKSDIMSESVLVSGYYVDEDAVSTKKANHEISAVASLNVLKRN